MYSQRITPFSLFWLLPLFLLAVSSSYGVTASLTVSNVGEDLPTLGTTSHRMLVVGDTANDRHGVPVDSTWFFQNDFIDPSGTFRIGYRLIDGAGQTVPIEVQDDAGTVVETGNSGEFAYTGSFTVTPGLIGVVRSEFVYLVPDTPLDQFGEYSVELRLQEWVEVSQFLSMWTDYTTESADDPASYVTFGLPGSLNVIALVDDMTVSRPWIIDGLQESFELSVEVDYYRYDPGGMATTVDSDFTIDLEAPGTENVPLTLIDGTDSHVSGTLQPTHLVTPSNFYQSTRVYTLRYTVQPTAPSGLLPSTEGAFYITVGHSHSDGGSVVSPAMAISSPLLHFNGQLNFGDVVTSITAAAAGPAAGDIGVFPAPPKPYAAAEFGSLAGLVDSTGHSYGPDTIAVRLLSNGVASVTGARSYLTTPSSLPDEFTVDGVEARRIDVRLDANGAVADSMSVRLPRGLGWAADLSDGNRMLSTWLDVTASVALDANLLPEPDSYKLATGSPIYLCEESKPFAFLVDEVFWDNSAAQLTWTSLDLVPVHADSWDRLESAASAAVVNGVNALTAQAWLKRPSNRQLLRYASLNATQTVVTCDVGARGDAQLSFYFNLASDTPGDGTPTYLYPHYPSGTYVAWDGLGLGEVTKDAITDGKLYTFVTPLGIGVNYDVAAPGATCGFSDTRTLIVIPDNDELLLTRDGGYVGAVDFISANPKLAWGMTTTLTDGVQAVHSVTGWTSDCVSFMAGGSFLRGTSTLALPATETGQGLAAPEALHASGFSIDNGSTVAERPGTPAYIAGAADYAGLNFRVAPAAGQIVGTTYAGGVRLPQQPGQSYTLKSNSKYYLRSGGTSGVHDVDPNTLDGDDLLIYGYPFSFGYFGLAYLDSSNDGLDSTTTGSTSFDVMPLADAVSFDLDFDAMSLSDGGQLQSGDLVLGASPKRALAYWDGSIKLRDFSFEPGAGGECANERFLTLGIEAYGSLIDQPMHGRVALHSTTSGGGSATFGNFLTYGEAQAMPAPLSLANGRLRLPGLVRMRGPADALSPGEYELYNLRTVGEAYFNNYDVAGGASVRPNVGFLAFPSTMDVSFFPDFPVHVRMPASNAIGGDAGTALGAMSGGWANLWEDPVSFDLNHEGFDISVSATDYWTRNYESPTQRINVEQEIFGIFDLNYDLEWQPSLGYFKSKKKTNSFYILETHHTVEYLSPERVDISFGASAGFEGLSGINLGNLAVNALDGTGVFDAISDAAQAEVAKGIDFGTRALNELIESYPESLFDVIFEGYLEASFAGDTNDPTALINQIITKAQTGATLRVDGVDTFDAEINASLDEIDDALQLALGPVGTGGEAIDKAGNLINEIDSRLMAAQNAIRAISGVTIDLPGGETMLRFRDGEVDFGDGLIVDWDELATMALQNNTVRQEIEDGAANLVQGLLGPADSEAEDIVAATFSRLVARLIILIAEEGLAGLELPSSYLDFGSISTDMLPDIVAEFGPTLLTVRANLVELDAAIGEIRKVFDGARQGTEGALGFLNEVESYGQSLQNLRTVVKDSFEISIREQLRIWEGVGSLEELDSVEARAEFTAFVKARLRDEILGSEFFEGVKMSLRQRVYDMNAAIRTQIDSVFAQAEVALKEQIAGLMPELDLGALEDFLSPFDKICAYGEVNGYLSVVGDRPDLLRMDALFEMSAPDEIAYHGFVEIKSQNSTGAGGSSLDGVDANEMTIDAINVPFAWSIGSGLFMDVGTKFSFDASGPRGFGGFFERNSGQIDFESFKITDVGFAAAFGLDENYLASNLEMVMKDYSIAGGIFLGRAASVEPIAIAHELTAETLYNDTGGNFTGALAYGYASIPISEALGIPSSCLFRISAGVGTGIFFFTEGPTFGGMMDADVSGEALCVVSVGGSVNMVGVKAGDKFRFNGKGRVSGKAGACPFCVKFGKTVKIKYINDQWKVSY